MRAHQFAHRKRFGDVVVGAHFQAADSVCLLRARGQHDDRQRRVRRAHLFADHEAVQVRQHQIEDDQIGRIVAHQFQSLFARAHRLHVEPFEFQGVAQAARDVRLVLHDQNAFAHASGGGEGTAGWR